MITAEEMDSIRDIIPSATDTLSRMQNIVELIESRETELVASVRLNDGTALSDALHQPTDLIAEIAALKDGIRCLNDVNQNASDVFSAFIKNEFVAYPWGSIVYSDAYVLDIVSSYVKQPNLSASVQENINAIQLIREIPNVFRETCLQISGKISAFRIFEKISDIAGNLVMIGANGSGKSTFSRQLRGKFSQGDNLTILSAQHLLTYSPQDSIPASDRELSKVREYQNQDKLIYDTYSINSAGSDMNQLISALYAQYIDVAIATLNSTEGDEKKRTILTRTVEIWESLVCSRRINISRSSLSAVTLEGIEYEFNRLSDGEKSIFYYIGHILLAEESSYIIVDEPENHLHPSICSKLWDVLECERQDCSFIYLTHDLEFAASRVDATLVWNKSFTPPDNWEFEILQSIDVIPDSLMLTLVGSKRDICFCEGDKGSIDYRLYSILFPSYNIIPVKGHEQVCSYTRAYNDNFAIFHHRAVGIIDRDYHSEAQISEWMLEGIYALSVNEVECLLCDSHLLDEAIKHFGSSEMSKQIFVESFWRELQRNINDQALKFTTDTINNSFRSNCLKKPKNIAELTRELNKVLSPQSAEDLFTQRLQELNTVIETKDYDSALQITSLKKALTRGVANSVVVDKYEDRVLNLLRYRDDLAEYLRRKYLPDVPSEDAGAR